MTNRRGWACKIAALYGLIFWSQACSSSLAEFFVLIFPLSGPEGGNSLSFEKIATQISSIFPKLTDIAGITPFYVLMFFYEIS
ncbi:hypothetical protein [Paenibacillus macerans]|uniref:hypothetical protein n=1 Tax=Paenibacillus macerans TaxID=44252 RepID=UPI000FD6E199|nr:hypothetical protein [Paenibacillus macerans]MCY7559412.1 hypothetical protein [Paenibacillus macerans]MEC0154954.1 hypothetical protein [Paenibacillus macerans]